MPKSTPQFDMANFLVGVTTKDQTSLHPRNDKIFHVGDPADRVYFLQTGKVKITVVSEQGKEAVVGIILPGEWFGQSCLSSNQSIRHSTATAMDTHVSVISIRRHIMLNWLADDKAFSNAFMMDLLARNDRIESDLTDQLFNSSEKRLARLLLTLAHYGTQRGPQPVLGDIDQATLALKIGATRASVSKFMNKFRRLGFISYNGHLEVNPSLLNAVLHEFPDDSKS